MTKIFRAKVIRCGIVDTKSYRYVADYDKGIIKRIPLLHLDTTYAIDGWEIVGSL